MKCPHCLDSFFPEFNTQFIDWLQNDNWLKAADRYWSIKTTKCPACGKAVIFLQQRLVSNENLIMDEMLVFPRGIARSQLPAEVPEKYALDYKEACLVLTDSAKASAALSRRCLQHVLAEEAGVKGDLAVQIQKILDAKALPSYLAEAIDGVRNIGNFAAHPIKSKNTGEIVEVEAGEAEWLLNTLEVLFDFYFVMPATLKKKQDALNAKLAEAGKPPMKS
jgi:hypothetical protein